MPLVYHGSKCYYYDNRWENGTCRSVYICSGLMALYLAEEEQTRREIEAEGREEARRAWDVRLARWDEALDAATAFGVAVERLARRVLEALGYHQHKRQWRKRRGTMGLSDLGADDRA